MTDRRRGDRHPRCTSQPVTARYLPLVSTFCFSSSFIFLTTGSRLASPVVLFVVAGVASLGIDVWPEGVVAGRVAVAAGGEEVWAFAGTLKRKALDSSDTASAILLGFIGLNSCQTNETAGPALRSRYASNCLP